MSSDQVLEAVLAIKGDVGEVKARIIALNAWLDAHVQEDQRAHERIAKLELAQAVHRGKLSVWHALSAAGGGLVMAGVQYALKVLNP